MVVLPTVAERASRSGPTASATRYVDMRGVSRKRTTFLPVRGSTRSCAGGSFDTTSSDGATTAVTSKRAFIAGSSKQGNARRASVASNWVNA